MGYHMLHVEETIVIHGLPLHKPPLSASLQIDYSLLNSGITHFKALKKVLDRGGCTRPQWVIKGKNQSMWWSKGW